MSSPSFSRRWRGLGATGAVRVLTLRGDLYVLPDEVLPLISADKVDERLFDVTDLIEMGYDDSHASGVPLIATFSKASRCWTPASTPPTRISLRRSTTG